VTGFFGQNFPWMIERIGGPGWFFALAIALQALIVAALLAFFRRRGWL
jgi:Mg2+ and Co2+ transporter CorA